jgi:hypothetical protein
MPHNREGAIDEVDLVAAHHGVKQIIITESCGCRT